MNSLYNILYMIASIIFANHHGYRWRSLVLPTAFPDYLAGVASRNLLRLVRQVPGLWDKRLANMADTTPDALACAHQLEDSGRGVMFHNGVLDEDEAAKYCDDQTKEWGA